MRRLIPSDGRLVLCLVDPRIRRARSTRCKRYSNPVQKCMTVSNQIRRSSWEYGRQLRYNCWASLVVSSVTEVFPVDLILTGLIRLHSTSLIIIILDLCGHSDVELVVTDVWIFLKDLLSSDLFGFLHIVIVPVLEIVVEDASVIAVEMIVSARLRADVTLDVSAGWFGASHLVAAHFLDKGILA